MRIIGLYFCTLLIASSCISPLNEVKKDPESITFTTDLENIDSLNQVTLPTWKHLVSVKEGNAFSGKNESVLDNNNEFSVVFEQKFGYLHKILPEKLTFSAMVNANAPMPEGSVVVSVSGNKYYRSYPIAEFIPKADNWYKVITSFNLPDSLLMSDQVKIYVWNRRKDVLRIDNPEVTLYFPEVNKD